jgi:hypothetical protein
VADERDPDERAALAEERLKSFVAGLELGGGDASGILEPAAAALFGAFASEGVDALLLKGPALARLLYTSDEHRPYVDLDLLVAPAQFERAEAVLRRIGYRNASERLGIDDVGGVVHADTWLSPVDGTSHEIDVHRWLPGAEAPVEAAWQALWAHRTPIEVSGAQIPVLAREGQALQLATHAAQHGPDYTKGTRELEMGLERWAPGVWREAAQLAAEVDATAAFAAGLRLVPDGEQLANALRLPDDPTFDWEIRHLDERPRGAFHVQAFREAGGPRERLRLLRRALLPNRRWLTVEYAWAQKSPLHLAAGYLLHLVRTPLWAARAWAFRRRRARRGG